MVKRKRKSATNEASNKKVDSTSKLNGTHTSNGAQASAKSTVANLKQSDKPVCTNPEAFAFLNVQVKREPLSEDDVQNNPFKNNPEENISESMQITNVRSLSSERSNAGSPAVETNSTKKPDENLDGNFYSKPLDMDQRDKAFGSFVACELSDLRENPALYMKTKQSILKLLTEAHFEQMSSGINPHPHTENFYQSMDAARTSRIQSTEQSGPSRCNSFVVPSSDVNRVNTSSSDFEKTVVKEIRIIKGNQRTMMEKLDRILNSINAHETSEKPDHNVAIDMKKLIPVNTFAELEKLEDKLTDENIFNQMINFLSKLGGSNCEQATKLMLRRIMTDDLAASFSYLGIRDKRAFKALEICKAILCAVRTHASWNQFSEADIEKTISNWLRHAKARVQNKKNSN